MELPVKYKVYGGLVCVSLLALQLGLPWDDAGGRQNAAAVVASGGMKSEEIVAPVMGANPRDVLSRGWHVIRASDLPLVRGPKTTEGFLAKIRSLAGNQTFFWHRQFPVCLAVIKAADGYWWLFDRPALTQGEVPLIRAFARDETGGEEKTFGAGWAGEGYFMVPERLLLETARALPNGDLTFYQVIRWEGPWRRYAGRDWTREQSQIGSGLTPIKFRYLLGERSSRN